MRVGLDARKLHDFGIGTYIQGLLDEYLARGEPEDLVVYLPVGATLGRSAAARARVTTHVERARPYSVGELWRLGLRARRDGLALFHAPHYVCPPILSCPAVVTIHDLIHLRFPAHRRHRLASLYARVMLRLALRRAARVIAVSESTRRDLVTRLGARPERIRVIPNGVGAHFRPAADPRLLASALAALGLVGPYWLFVGNPLPHKNLPRLLDAFRAAPPELGRLALAGIPPAARAAVEHACAIRGLQPRIVILGPLPGRTMPVLYQGATALVCPSLWEGFGFPAVEAMACGTPVLAGDRGALPEVLAGAGVLVDPTSVDALREAMYNLAVDGTLRAARRAAGLARVRAFSWRQAAEATLGVYREVLEGAGGARVTDAGRAGP